MMSDNIHELPNLERDQFAADFEQAHRAIRAITPEIRTVLAAHRFAMFRAYVDAGFTEAQAVELAKNLP